MTFDREPDLDNANGGKPDTKAYVTGITKSNWKLPDRELPFLFCEVFLW